MCLKCHQNVYWQSNLVLLDETSQVRHIYHLDLHFKVYIYKVARKNSRISNTFLLLLCFLFSWFVAFGFLSFRTPFKTFFFLPAQRWGWMMVGMKAQHYRALAGKAARERNRSDVPGREVPEFTHKCEFLLNDLSLHRRRLCFWQILSPGPEGGGGVAVEEIRCRLPILIKLVVFHLNLFPITSNNWLALRKTACFVILKGVENVSSEEQGYS